MISGVLLRRITIQLEVSKRTIFREDMCIALLALVKDKHPNLSYRFDNVRFRILGRQRLG